MRSSALIIQVHLHNCVCDSASIFTVLVLFVSLHGEDGVSASMSRIELSGMHERG